MAWGGLDVTTGLKEFWSTPKELGKEIWEVRITSGIIPCLADLTSMYLTVSVLGDNRISPTPQLSPWCQLHDMGSFFTLHWSWNQLLILWVLHSKSRIHDVVYLEVEPVQLSKPFSSCKHDSVPAHSYNSCAFSEWTQMVVDSLSRVTGLPQKPT